MNTADETIPLTVKMKDNLASSVLLWFGGEKRVLKKHGGLVVV